ncbi:hypothetical protein AVEN_128631-1 [Araneus ventricosus]|uniref:Uncharacterized protein n=1 Tax=Araneus ventricosus TaxID=182803 RepID=A0A4Y2KKV0_ARAVE|nr:hypothetical protein AVEN_128631-1 [Araneus ventricosus]
MVHLNDLMDWEYKWEYTYEECHNETMIEYCQLKLQQQITLCNATEVLPSINTNISSDAFFSTRRFLLNALNRLLQCDRWKRLGNNAYRAANCGSKLLRALSTLDPLCVALSPQQQQCHRVAKPILSASLRAWRSTIARYSRYLRPEHRISA